MKVRSLLVTLFVLVTVISAPGTGRAARGSSWTTTLPGVTHDTIDDATRVAITPTGDAVTFGFRRAADDSQTVFVARVGADSMVLWEREMPVVAPFMNPVGLALTPDGDIVTLAATVVSGVPNGILARLAPDGTPRWSRYVFAPDEPAAAAGLARSPDGDLVVIATRRLGSGGIVPSRAVVRRFDGAGGLEWTSEIGVGERNQALDVAVSRNGSTHVVGWTRRTLAQSELAHALHAVVDRNGNIVQALENSRSGAHLIAWEVAVAPNGDVFFAGTERVNSRTPAVRAYAAKLHRNGHGTSWFVPLVVPGWSFNGGIAVTADGRLVQGASEIYDDGLHTVVRVLDSRTGAELFRRGQFDEDAHQEDTHDVAIRGATEVTVAGGRTLADGTWRAYVAREVLEP